MSKKKILSLTSIIALSALVIGVSAHADQGMKSTGVINVENTQNPAVYDVVFDVRDIAEMDKMITVGKTEISRVINEYSNQNVLQMDSFENFTESVSSLTELPDNTYYYDRVTAGKDCKRYIKQGGEYYECNANGIKTGTTPLSDTYTTISIVAKDHTTAPAAGEVQLVEYELATEPEMSAGYTGYADKKQIIGSGEDSQFAYNDAFQDGYNDAVNNTGAVVYTYHVHKKGDGTASSSVLYANSNPGGCYVGSRHTHNAVTRCGTKTVTTNCPGSAYVSNGPHGPDTSGQVYYVGSCPVCGGRLDRYGSPGNENCDANEKTTTEYTCGSPVNTWVIGCGKDSSIPDNITINFP